MPEKYDPEMFPIRSGMTEKLYAELSAWTLERTNGSLAKPGIKNLGFQSPRARLLEFLSEKGL